MAEKFSTGLRDALLGGDSLRRLMADFVLDIYSGSPPATADAAATGTKLCRVTKASGTVDATEKSVAEQAHLEITVAAEGATIILTINGVAYTYTVVAADTTLRAVAKKVALMVDAVPLMRAMAEASADGDGTVVIQSKIPGLGFTITKGGTATSTLTEDTVANSRCDALQFGDPATGAIPKETGQTWSGVNLATGTAGYFRFVLPDDTAGESTTAIRIQGSVGTGGAELNLSSLSFTVDAVTSISGGSITLPVG